MKKILSIFAAAAVALTMSASVFAETEEKATKAVPASASTITFDTDKVMDYVHTFGNAEDTNLTLELADSGAVQGRCLKLKESFAEDVGNQYGGIYFSSADFGLDSFAGYTMTVNIKTTADAAKATSSFQVFSDGAQWVATDFSTSNSGKWSKVSVTVPADKANNKMGVSIPITSAFSGDVAFIDEVVITDNYGEVLPNVGDADTSLAEAPNGVVSVLTTILFILLIIVVLLGVVFAVLKLVRRYR